MCLNEQVSIETSLSSSEFDIVFHYKGCGKVGSNMVIFVNFALIEQIFMLANQQGCHTRRAFDLVLSKWVFLPQ